MMNYDAMMKQCGGHIFSDTNFTLHDDGSGSPYLTSTVVFQHYNTESLCFQAPAIENGDNVYQSDIFVMNLAQDIHTTPVVQVSARYANLRPDFKEQHNWPPPLRKNEGYYLGLQLNRKCGL